MMNFVGVRTLLHKVLFVDDLRYITFDVAVGGGEAVAVGAVVITA